MSCSPTARRRRWIASCHDLTPDQWRALPRLPDGAWCRPLAWEPKSHWGLVVGASLSDGLYTYDVLMDGETKSVRVPDGALEPILLVRGSDGGTERPPETATWQRAYAPHRLVSDGRRLLSCLGISTQFTLLRPGGVGGA